jgi:hypothetical protein
MIVGDIAQSLFLAADFIFRRHCSIAQPDYKNGKQRIYTLLAEKSARELLRSRTGEWRSRNSSNFSAGYKPSHGEKKSLHNNDICLAEGVGFEPTIRFPVYTLSKRAPSATRPPLRKGRAPQTARHKGARTIITGGGVATRSRPPATVDRGLWTLSMILSENRFPLFGIML